MKEYKIENKIQFKKSSQIKQIVVKRTQTKCKEITK